MTFQTLQSAAQSPEGAPEAPASAPEGAARGQGGGGYENAPATRLLATRCAACGRPLVDAISVESGMGPDCREKYGYSEGPEEGRAEANRRVYAIALGAPPAEIIGHLLCIRAVGFDRLADRLGERLATVTIREVDGATLAIETPYSPDFVAALKSALPWRRWEPTAKVWHVPATRQSKNALWALLRRFYAGTIGLGPQGPFAV